MNKLYIGLSKNLLSDNYKLLFQLIPYLVVPSRNTFILKRRNPCKLVKKHITFKKFKAPDFIYDLVENTEQRPQQEIEIVLKKMVEGVGNKGDVVTLSKHKAYNNFLITGLADYATPEIIERARSEKNLTDSENFSSRTVPQQTLIRNVKMIKKNIMGHSDWLNCLIPCQLNQSLISDGCRKSNFKLLSVSAQVESSFSDDPYSQRSEKMFDVSVSTPEQLAIIDALNQSLIAMIKTPVKKKHLSEINGWNMHFGKSILRKNLRKSEWLCEKKSLNLSPGSSCDDESESLIIVK